MRQYSLDANILLRYLLKDVPAQREAIRHYFLEARDQEAIVYVSVLVFSEVLYTLMSFYKKSRTEVAQELYRFISLPYLEIEKRNILLDALLQLSKTKLSFVDVYLSIEAKARGMDVVTFDKKLSTFAKSLTKEYTTN